LEEAVSADGEAGVSTVEEVPEIPLAALPGTGDTVSSPAAASCPEREAA
jgi:hypothetical protein